MQLALFRWGGVVIVLLPYIYYKKDILLKAMQKNFLIIFTLGALGIAGFNTFLFYGLQDTTATNALLINSSIPILIIALSAIVNSERVTLLQLFGIVLSTLGVMFLVIKGDFSNIVKLEFNKGDFWIIVSSFDWAFYSILLKYKPKDLKPFEFISAITLLGFIVLIAVYFVTGHGLTASSFELRKEVYFAILFMIFFPSLLSFYFWNRGVLEIGPNKTGQFTHLMPIFGAFLAYIFLDEVLELYHVYGIVLIGLGIYLSIFLKKGKA